METPKFTPGKWVAEPFRVDKGIAICGVVAIEREGHGVSVCVAPRFVAQPQWKVDSRLIAAAPDLYAACKAALAALGLVTSNAGDDRALDNIAGDCEEAERVIAAALARAEGRAE